MIYNDNKKLYTNDLYNGILKNGKYYKYLWAIIAALRVLKINGFYKWLKEF